MCFYYVHRMGSLWNFHVSGRLHWFLCIIFFLCLLLSVSLAQCLVVILRYLQTNTKTLAVSFPCKHYKSMACKCQSSSFPGTKKKGLIKFRQQQRHNWLTVNSTSIRTSPPHESNKHLPSFISWEIVKENKMLKWQESSKWAFIFVTWLKYGLLTFPSQFRRLGVP